MSNNLPSYESRRSNCVVKGTRVSVFLAWYDIWVGVYIDRKNKTVYVCLLPCVVIKLEFGVTG